MKKTLTSFASLATASIAMAHTSAVPHAHEASGTNWMPAILCAIAVAGTLVFALRTSKASRRSK